MLTISTEHWATGNEEKSTIQVSNRQTRNTAEPGPFLQFNSNSGIGISKKIQFRSGIYSCTEHTGTRSGSISQNELLFSSVQKTHRKPCDCVMELTENLVTVHVASAVFMPFHLGLISSGQLSVLRVTQHDDGAQLVIPLAAQIFTFCP